MSAQPTENPKNQLSSWKLSNPRELRGIDFLIVATILFAGSIYTSTLSWLYMDASAPPGVASDTQGNYSLLSTLLASMALAVVYLRLVRAFDFRALRWGVSWKATLWGVPIYLSACVLADLVYTLWGLGFPPADVGTPEGTAAEQASHVSTVMVAMVNGSYEEIGFLGFLLSVPRKYTLHAFIAGLAIRFSFHTYQGIGAALSITSFGLLLGVLYLRMRTLWPFIVAHVLADIWGLSVDSWAHPLSVVLVALDAHL
ncbi:CPBP family intramembrane metalloprotease [Dyella sp. LX-66]|uniref:CPBP family intramembrane glutamic endopeptidase n=1 Tax=unclassified Dyella TaxID=2634549 RepID=UPI001BE089F7|nr:MULTISPECIES: CPBP family intramembrane glutamic endopeptidase [unclassified Dyella]MBT2115823.1 CPBP family intramembrane metalloprotease [Dyella sp. LX-1]MBT2139638.1 CPBP family intramembrane metalloprotease [Dyella sp. LX-66]